MRQLMYSITVFGARPISRNVHLQDMKHFDGLKEQLGLIEVGGVRYISMR